MFCTVAVLVVCLVYAAVCCIVLTHVCSSLPLRLSKDTPHTMCVGSVQVNTSGEESKYGVEPKDCVPLAAHIARKCASLRLAGLMTIGMPDYSSRPENFQCLAQCR